MMIIHFHNYNFNLISINGHRPHKQKFYEYLITFRNQKEVLRFKSLRTTIKKKQISCKSRNLTCAHQHHNMTISVKFNITELIMSPKFVNHSL